MEDSLNPPVLYLVHDPMCSWCWAFRKVWREVRRELTHEVAFENVLGGLAEDSGNLMPSAMQKSIARIWKQIEREVPGTRFNYSFWEVCEPRRSTYPACRAVLCAAEQDAEEVMILAIQQAYYLQARNPSDIDVLISLAGDIGLDVVRFRVGMASEGTQEALLSQIGFARQMGGYSFPSLFFKGEGGVSQVPLSYTSSHVIIQTVRQML